MEDHEDDIENNKKQHIPRAKGKPIKNNNNNKPSYLTVKETLLKENHTRETKK